VTNTWNRRLEAGDRFEDLVGRFRENGFRDIELRDGDELRTTPFGRFLSEIESVLEGYSATQWKTLCRNSRHLKSATDLYADKDRSVFFRIAELAELTQGICLSYAVAHPWMGGTDDLESDNRRILRAKKLAYLLGPERARLRLVDPDAAGPVDAAAAVATLRRYSALLGEMPVMLCVENARLPAVETLEYARRAGVGLAYDEANIYGGDGSAIDSPGAFWGAVDLRDLTSVHIKQKGREGVLTQIRDGYVDFKTIIGHLKAKGYTGDLLFENAPSDQPLEDALCSREYLFKLCETL